MKHKLFWIIYYSSAILLNVVAAIVLREHWNFNWFSAFPIGYILLIVWFQWYYPSDFRIAYVNWDNTSNRMKHALYRTKYDKDIGFYEQPEPDNSYTNADNFYHHRITKWSEQHVAVTKHVCRLLLLVLPIFLMWIFFFSNYAKGLSGLIIIPLTHIIGYSYDIILTKRNKDARQNDLRKELEEQERREELGKWK